MESSWISSRQKTVHYDLFRGLSKGSPSPSNFSLSLLFIGLFTCSILELLITISHDPNISFHSLLLSTKPLLSSIHSHHRNEGEHRRVDEHVSSKKNNTYASLARQDIQEPFSARYLLSYCSRPIQWRQ